MSNYELLYDETSEQADIRNKKFRENDNRPQISLDNTSLNYGNIIHKNETEKIIRTLKEEEIKDDKEKKTVMDMPLKDIIGKTTETTSNFWEDFKIKLVEAKHLYNQKYDLDDNYTMTFSDLLNINILAFVEYMKDNDNILFIGIFLLIISVILYIFNISS